MTCDTVEENADCGGILYNAFINPGHNLHTWAGGQGAVWKKKKEKTESVLFRDHHR